MHSEKALQLLKTVEQWNAYRQSHPDWVPNLQGIDLHGPPAVHLNGADLRNADLSNANLTCAVLAEADLTRARLHGANLSETMLSGAVLHEADLRGANLTNAQLKRTYFSQRITQLQKADLSRTIIHNADLSEADLSGANLNGASLQGSDLHNACLGEASLCQADLGGANLYEVVFRGADLSHANFEKTLPQGAVFCDANLRGANLKGATLTRSLKSRRVVDFRGADLTDADLSGADLTDADFTNARLTNTKLQGAILDNAKGLTRPRAASEGTATESTKDKEHASIRCRCLTCGKAVKVSPTHAGKTVKCPNPECGKPIKVPAIPDPARPLPVLVAKGTLSLAGGWKDVPVGPAMLQGFAQSSRQLESLLDRLVPVSEAKAAACFASLEIDKPTEDRSAADVFRGIQAGTISGALEVECSYWCFDPNSQSHDLLFVRRRQSVEIARGLLVCKLDRGSYLTWTALDSAPIRAKFFGAGQPATKQKDSGATHVVFRCEFEHRIKVPASMIGKTIRCPHKGCNVAVVVPTQESEQRSREPLKMAADTPVLSARHEEDGLKLADDEFLLVLDDATSEDAAGHEAAPPASAVMPSRAAAFHAGTLDIFRQGEVVFVELDGVPMGSVRVEKIKVISVLGTDAALKILRNNLGALGEHINKNDLKRIHGLGLSDPTDRLDKLARQLAKLTPSAWGKGANLLERGIIVELLKSQAQKLAQLPDQGDSLAGKRTGLAESAGYLENALTKLGNQHIGVKLVGKMLAIASARVNGQPEPTDAELDEKYGKTSACFIAAAACGNEWADDVAVLRELRDRMLRPSRLGNVLIRFYEIVSPFLAEFIVRVPLVQRLVRTWIVGPASTWAAKILGSSRRDRE